MNVSRGTLVVALGLLGGCKSDAEKLERLRLDRDIATLTVLLHEQRADSVRIAAGMDNVAYRAQLDSARSAKNRLDILNRDIDRLLR